MKKPSPRNSKELRTEYKLSDFPSGLVRGKYASRIAAGSNIVVLDPKLSSAFPTSAAVNSALRSLLRLASSAARPTMRSSRPRKMRVTSTKRP